MFLGTLGANLLENLLTSNGVTKGGEGVVEVGAGKKSYQNWQRNN